MSTVISGKGHCLCGAVQFTTENMSQHVGACHCSMCRKWGGGPYMEVECGANVVFKAEENISLFDSSDWAERGFCSQCGSHLFYRLKHSQEYSIPVGLFDDDSNLVFNKQIFIDEKPAFYSFANKTKDMTGAEVFAMYASAEK